MKRFTGLLFLLICMAACNHKDNKDHSNGKETAKSKADSLMEDVMDGHDVGMSKYGRLNARLKEVRQAIDSLTKLPASVREKTALLKQGLENTASELSDAIASMDKWMEEFNMDSAVNNMEQRINYLLHEKLKVGKVKESILKSLQDADSVLQQMNR